MIPKPGRPRLALACEQRWAAITIALDMTGPFERKEAVVIVNAAAYNAAKRKVLSAADGWLREHGWKAEWAGTSGAGDATATARMAAERRVPIVFVCCGDGPRT